MNTDLRGLLQLSHDALIVPVQELEESSLAQIDWETGDFALSRMHSRAGSKIIGAEAAGVLQQFREPRSVVEAVILFAQQSNADPEAVLADAYPFLQSMAEGGYLVRTDGEGQAGAAPADATDPDHPHTAAPTEAAWEAGHALPAAKVLRTLQTFDESAVLLLARRDGHASVLKVERRRRDGSPITSVRARLAHEAAMLDALPAGIAPAVLGLGEVDGRFALELEHVAGTDVATAADEWCKRAGPAAAAQLLALLRAVARQYARLHDAGVLHADVHPRNVLVLADASVRLIDFGMAVSIADAQRTGVDTLHGDRGGVPFFFEPELAAAARAGMPAPPPSAAGEQHAVATLLYLLATGAYWHDFRLGREALLEDIATRAPLPFSERGARPWPALEAVLARALDKDPAQRFASMAEFAAALDTVEPPAQAGAAVEADDNHRGLVDDALASAALEGPWLAASAFDPPPTASVNYGSAGVALALLHIARQRHSAEVLALADLWSLRALREAASGEPAAFFNAEIEITPEVVGHASPFHSASGAHAVVGLLAAARGDVAAMAQAISGFLQHAQAPASGIDLTLGRAGLLLAAAILLDAATSLREVETGRLRAFGEQAMAALWQELDAKPPIAEADIEYLGIAHGWAGLLYASLHWCSVADAAVPAGLPRRLDELGALAMPSGRGVEWPWLLRRPGEPLTMAGWCNGTCGHVFLFSLSHRVLGREGDLALALRAGHRSWDAEENTDTLCCGLAGRGYALLNLYRSTGEQLWLDRARDLVGRALHASRPDPRYLHSLYKGRLGLAVLAAELEHPEESSTPLFEPMGYGLARAAAAGAATA